MFSPRVICCRSVPAAPAEGTGAASKGGVIRIADQATRFWTENARAHEDVTPGKQPRAPDLVPRCVNAGDTSVYPQTITGVLHAIENRRPGRGAARLDGGIHQGHIERSHSGTLHQAARLPPRSRAADQTH